MRHTNASLALVLLILLPTIAIAAPAQDYDPAWSPDGTKIAFDDAVASIWVMNADGSNPTDLTPSMPYAEMPNWQRLPGAAVGGVVEPVNKLVVFAPYLALFGVVATVAVVVVKPWKKRGN